MEGVIDVAMRRVVIAAVLLVVGAAMVVLPYRGLSKNADYVKQHGVSVSGEIVSVDGNAVTLEFALNRERLRATAHPSDGELFMAGEFVWVTVLREDPTRVVIEGTTESPPLVATGVLVLGGLTVLAGIGMLLSGLVATPVAGRFPPFKWMQERHGGA